MKMRKLEIFHWKRLFYRLGLDYLLIYLVKCICIGDKLSQGNTTVLKTYSLYVADVSFSNFIDSLRNVGGAQVIPTIINFQEKLFYLEQSGKALLPNRTRNFGPPPTVRCQYTSSKETKITIMKIEILKLLVSTMAF